MPILRTFLKSIKSVFKPKKRYKKKQKKPRLKPPARKKTIQRKKKSSTRKRTRKAVRPARKRRKTFSRMSAQGQNAPTTRKKITKTVRRKVCKPKRSKPVSQQGLKKQLLRPPLKAAQSPGIRVGEITHYFAKIEVAVVKVTGNGFRIGDQLRISGGIREFIQPVRSLQVESVDVTAVRKGHLVGMKVDVKVQPGDKVYKV